MMSRTSADSRSRRSTSRLENGSSSSSRSGRGASARASATRCCWPPEISCGYLSQRRAAGRPARPARARALAPGRVARRPNAMLSRDARGAGTARSPGTPCRCAAARAARVAPAPDTCRAVDAGSALRAVLEAGDAAQHRGLAAAARAEQAADRAARQRERQAAHDLVVAIGVARGPRPRSSGDAGFMRRL